MVLNYKTIVPTNCLIGAIIVAVLCVSAAFIRSQNDCANTESEPGKFADPSLKSVTVIFRHGDRAPIVEYKTYSEIYKNDFPEGKGQLTKVGKQHMYQKGKFFRRLYNGFISDLYLDHEISIKTTNISRTFMSAAMVLAGMYPPKDYQKWSEFETVWQPIPIAKDSPDKTTIFGEKCPFYKELFLKELDSQMEKIYINNNNENQTSELLSYLSEKCEQPIQFMDINHLYDLFHSMISNGLRLPEWIRPNHIQIMESVYTQVLTIYNGNNKLQKLISGPLLKEISSNMELQSIKSNYNAAPKKIYLYAGHDWSLGTINYFLGNNVTNIPDFGASIHFHLILDDTIGYIIKMYYYHKWDDEKGEEMSISICGNPCTLNNFIKRINEHFSIEWEKECKKVES